MILMKRTYNINSGFCWLIVQLSSLFGCMSSLLFTILIVSSHWLVILSTELLKLCLGDCPLSSLLLKTRTNHEEEIFNGIFTWKMKCIEINHHNSKQIFSRKLDTKQKYKGWVYQKSYISNLIYVSTVCTVAATTIWFLPPCLSTVKPSLFESNIFPGHPTSSSSLLPRSVFKSLFDML